MDDDKLFIDTFRSAIYAFGHEKFAEFAASIAAFGFPAKVEFYADPAAGTDVLLLRMVAQEGAHWTDVSIDDECSFGLRANHRGRVVEHVARIDPAAGAHGELTTICCLHSLSPAVLDKELIEFLRAVLEVRARKTTNDGGA
ncbi:MAG: hypothetical protein ABI434_00485 [Burkholderiaceae bacterium]